MDMERAKAIVAAVSDEDAPWDEDAHDAWNLALDYMDSRT